MLVSLLLLDEVFNDGAPSAEGIPSIEDLNDDVRAVDDLVEKMIEHIMFTVIIFILN
jgi:hypothetical protein